jgi:hypothetical protein
MHSNSELPFLFNLGDHVATTKILGNKATIPPPIPLLPVIPLGKLTTHHKTTGLHQNSTSLLDLVKICFPSFVFLIGEKEKK